ncbi:MAG: hypothetical protein V4858_01490 [Pseudomonadota bacterium]
MSDEKFYAVIADELEHKKTDRVLWTRAMGEAGGDGDKTNALYIRLRLAELKKAAAVAIDATLTLEPATSAAVLRLRSELAQALSENGKSSFYSVLNISPEATDAEVAAAISRYEARVEAGHASATPEFKYAKDSLGNPRSREIYDQRLSSNWTADAGPSSRHPGRRSQPQSEPDSVLLQLWESRKATVIVGALSLCVVGYMFLGFYKEREESAARKKSIEAQILQTQKNAENDAIRAEAEKALAAGTVRNTATVIDRSSQIGNRSMDIQLDAENRRRQELEYRAAENARSQEMQREAQDRRLAMQEQRTYEAKRQMDERRAEREKRYWACMNAALDRNSETTANARCASYR